MKKVMTLVFALMFAVGLSGLAVAASLDSPGAPSDGSGMYTLQNLYDYLTSGMALTVQTGFQEPTSSPTTGTMKSTKQIGDAIKALHDQCLATGADVKSGVTFFCTQPGSWGVQTGTGLMQPTPTPTPTITPAPTVTPTKTWYEQYGPGPGGQDLVVQIGSMYVAKWSNNAGTNNNTSTDWTTACSWGTGLNWLGKSAGSWRLPTGDELTTICENKGSLGGYTASPNTSAITGYER